MASENQTQQERGVRQQRRNGGVGRRAVEMTVVRKNLVGQHDFK